MEEYSVLDIFSYVPKQKIDLEQLETIFVNEINNVNAATNGYYVEKYKQIHELEKNIKIAVEDLQNHMVCFNNNISVFVTNCLA